MDVTILQKYQIRGTCRLRLFETMKNVLLKKCTTIAARIDFVEIFLEHNFLDCKKTKENEKLWNIF